jgi:hypothetical protein
MDLPIQLNFFKKLELYQELKGEDSKATDAEGNIDIAWRIERDILNWTVKNHHHLGTPLTETYILDPKNDVLSRANATDPNSVPRAMENLIQRGFAEQDHTGRTIQIKISKEGLLMGEVIYDTRAQNLFRKYKYVFFLCLTWILIILGIILLILNVVTGFHDALHDVFHAHQNFQHSWQGSFADRFWP